MYNVIIDSNSETRDDLRATEDADIFVMQNDGARDLIRGFDVGTDKIDVSAFAASFNDLEIRNLERNDGSTSWVSVVDRTDQEEVLVRFDGDTVLDASNLTVGDFIFV